MKLGGLLLLLCLGVCGSTVYKPNWDSLDTRPLPAWYDEAKIGIFIHWGVFSVPSLGSEWFWSNWNNKNKKVVDYMKHNFKPNFTYAEFAPQFTAEFFDPKQWAAIFKKSGARYVVLTSKHHEGYTLWPSKYSFNWNAMAIGPKRDLVGDLAKAVREQKLHFGLYHSLLEWFHPLYLQDKKNQWKTQDFVKNKIRPEMEELVMQYHPEVIWSDGEWESTDTYWGSTHFLAWLFNESPVKNTVVVNDRWGQGILCKHGSFLTCHDKYNPGKLQSRKWENAMTIDRYSWGFRREAVLDDYLTIEELLRNLVTTVSCGGNLLINIGPTAYGKIEPIFEERLTQLGQWLEVNGEAIYKSHPWTHQNDTLAKDVWYTQRENNVYAIFLYVPNEEKVVLGALDHDQVNSIELLGSKTKVQFEKNLSGSGTLVHFPQITLNDQAKYVFTFKVTVKA